MLHEPAACHHAAMASSIPHRTPCWHCRHMISVEPRSAIVQCGRPGASSTCFSRGGGNGCDAWEREPGIDDDDWDPPGVPVVAPYRQSSRQPLDHAAAASTAGGRSRVVRSLRQRRARPSGSCRRETRSAGSICRTTTEPPRRPAPGLELIVAVVALGKYQAGQFRRTSRRTREPGARRVA